MTEPIIGWRAWSFCRPVDRWDFAEFVAILESSASFAEVRERQRERRRHQCALRHTQRQGQVLK